MDTGQKARYLEPPGKLSQEGPSLRALFQLSSETRNRRTRLRRVKPSHGAGLSSHPLQQPQTSFSWESHGTRSPSFAGHGADGSPAGSPHHHPPHFFFFFNSLEYSSTFISKTFETLCVKANADYMSITFQKSWK